MSNTEAPLPAPYGRIGFHDVFTADQMRAYRLTALAQPAASGEPVAWAFEHSDGRLTYHSALNRLTAYRDTCVREWPLYEAPQPAPRVARPLTDVQVEEGAADAGYNVYKLTAFVEGARFAESHHGITAHLKE